MKILHEIKKLVKSYLYADNLAKLAIIYDDTDKWGEHWYARRYEKEFRNLRRKKLTILEIGIGGYYNPKEGGASLRMWKRYFPRSMIYGIDLYDKSAVQEKRIKTFQGNQADEDFLKDICNKTGPLDIIIDDGSHVNNHVITSFKILFPFLKDGGIYIIEDTHASYFPAFGGDSINLANPNTVMNFFKKLTDCLNYEEYLIPGYKPTYFDKHIVAIHFYHNLIFVYKGLNNEGSQQVKDGICLIRKND